MCSGRKSSVAAVPGTETGLPGNSTFDFMVMLWAQMPWTHRWWDTEEAKTKTKTGQEGERERGEDERQPAEVGTEMRRQYEIEEGREEGETRSTFPILPVLTQPLRHKVLRQQRGTRVSSTLTFTLAHAHMPRQLCPGLRTASCLLPPDPERQLSWGHSTVPAIIT